MENFFYTPTEDRIYVDTLFTSRASLLLPLVLLSKIHRGTLTEVTVT